MKILIFTFCSLLFSLISFSQSGVKKYKVGDFAEGGIIFYIDESGQHGLVCAKSDQAQNIQWDTEVRFTGGAENLPERNTKSVAILDGVYSGKENTQSIIKFVGETDIPYAAKICDDFILELDSVIYDDWYLPSREELNMMYLNRTIINEVALKHGGDSFEIKRYWSSTDVDCSIKPYSLMNNVHSAYGHNFSLGIKKYQTESRKYMPYSVRAIRAF